MSDSKYTYSDKEKAIAAAKTVKGPVWVIKSHADGLFYIERQFRKPFLFDGDEIVFAQMPIEMPW